MNGRRAAKLRTELQEALQGVDDFLADVITRADTELKEFDAPYLRTYRIYRISLETLHGEVAHHVGYASDAPVYILDGQSDELVELAHTDHVTIDSAVLAVAYATAYLWFGRSPRELFYVVRSIDEVQFLPQPNTAESRVQERFRAKYAPIVSPPEAVPTPTGYRVSLYAMRQQALERHVLQIESDASVTDRCDTLEKHAPVVYGV